MKKLNSIVLGTILFLLIIFLVQNLRTVSINFLFWGIDLPRIVLVVLVFLAGAVFGAITHSLMQQNNKQS